MKRLERFLVATGIVVSVALTGWGLYRCDKFPEQYLENTSLICVGLVSLTGSVGLALRDPVQKYITGKRDYL